MWMEARAKALMVASGPGGVGGGDGGGSAGVLRGGDDWVRDNWGKPGCDTLMLASRQVAWGDVVERGHTGSEHGGGGVQIVMLGA